MELWHSTTAEEIAAPPGLAAIPFERKGVYALGLAQMPVTVLIPGWGLLQVAGLDDRNRDQPTALMEWRRTAYGLVGPEEAWSSSGLGVLDPAKTGVWLSFSLVF